MGRGGMTMNDVLSKAIETYGKEAQIDKAIEEMSELTKALLKLRYVQKDYEREIVQDAVSEEMADVEIMMTQLHMIFDNTKKVEEYQIKKIKRLERRLS
jgi:hypothetical protein